MLARTARGIAPTRGYVGQPAHRAQWRQPSAGVLPTRQTPSRRLPRRDYRVGLVLPWASNHRVSAKGCDIVHVHTLGPVGLAGLTAAHHAGIPAVLTWHTDLIAYRPYYP